MDGQTIVSEKLSFIESATKSRVTREQVCQDGIKLIAAANNHQLLFIGHENKSVKAISIESTIQLRKKIDSNQFVYGHELSFRPTLLSIPRNGYSSILLVAGLVEQNNVPLGEPSWPVIELFDIDTRESIGKLELKELSGSRIVDYAWHPTYCDSILTLCTDNFLGTKSKPNLLVVGFSRKEKRLALVYKNHDYGALTCCWSPKGKHLAIGLSDGRVLRSKLTITSTSLTLTEVKNSTIVFAHQRMTPEYRLVKIRWLAPTSLICVHAKYTNDGPDTIFTICSIEPSKPYRYWTNVCYEKADRYYDVQIVNLVSHIICASNASSEVAVFGLENGEWCSIVIDGEGGRIELPLDENNKETYSRGLTTFFLRNNTEVNGGPILVYYTSNGVICSFAAAHTQGSLRFPDSQPLEECPLIIPKPLVSWKPDPKPTIRPIDTKHNDLNSYVAPPTTQLFSCESISQMDQAMKNIKEGIKLNEVSTNLLGEINQLRTKFDEVLDIHKTHREVLDSVKTDIDSLDLAMLENLYLIEYIKTRSKRTFSTNLGSINPRLAEKIEGIKQKSREISEKLRDLNTHVDVSWEDFVRRRKALENKDRRLNSLDLVYKTLATNQKVINFLKKKSERLAELPTTPKTSQIICDTARLELDPASMRALREFLASRTVVPVRRP